MRHSSRGGGGCQPAGALPKCPSIARAKGGPGVDIGLCMTVKDEANTIEECLEGIVDLFAEVIVFDTGSTDGTVELLKDRFNIDALPRTISRELCNSVAPVRNEGYGLLKTPWVLCLDADERIARDDLKKIIEWPNDNGPGGYFSAWVTVLPNGYVIEDYKLGLFRKGFEKRGLVHENAQPSLREAGATAEWTDAFEILHKPEKPKLAVKNEYYSWRLDQAIEMDPKWIRYYWFRGILHERMGDSALARKDFIRAFGSRSKQFPVECLNAGMALAGQLAREGDREGALNVTRDAFAFHDEMAGDFEVTVNFRLKPWFERTLAHLEDGNLDHVVPYDFAHGRPSRSQ